jgi:hypothetical protein
MILLVNKIVLLIVQINVIPLLIILNNMIIHKPVLIVVLHNIHQEDISSVILIQIQFGSLKVVSFVFSMNQDTL